MVPADVSAKCSVAVRLPIWIGGPKTEVADAEYAAQLLGVEVGPLGSDMQLVRDNKAMAVAVKERNREMAFTFITRQPYQRAL